MAGPPKRRGARKNFPLSSSRRPGSIDYNVRKQWLFVLFDATDAGDEGKLRKQRRGL